MSNRNKIISAQAASTERAAAVLAGHVDWRKWPPTRQIDYLFSFATPKELYAQVGFRSVLGQLYENCVVGRKLADQKRVELVLRELAGKRTELLLRPEAVKALGAITKHYRYRVRELADWVPKSKNVFRQLESLVRHLFDQYGDVPAWVLNAWLEGELLQNGVSIPALTVHVGSGQALRSFTGLPVPLTRKLEHEMRQAPAGCTLLEALRYAQLALRGALAWHGPVLESRLGREAAPEDNDFWLSVVDFFAATPMVDSRHFGPVCDWIYQKRTVGIAPEPAQPNFSLKGRSMVSVLAQTERWHRTLAQTRRHTGTDYPVTTTWAGLLVPNFAGSTEDRVRITQLHTFEHLIAEGRALNHCVASYVGSCLKGRCGIFSVTIDGARALTLEVSQSYVIVQARGKHNRPMTADERFWVAKWATKAHLTLSKHV